MSETETYFHAVCQAGDHRNELDCPVCGLKDAFTEGGAWEICKRCFWEDDPTGRDDPEMGYGPNKGMCLRDARELLEKGLKPHQLKAWFLMCSNERRKAWEHKYFAPLDLSWDYTWWHNHPSFQDKK